MTKTFSQSTGRSLDVTSQSSFNQKPNFTSSHEERERQKWYRHRYSWVNLRRAKRYSNDWSTIFDCSVGVYTASGEEFRNVACGQDKGPHQQGDCRYGLSLSEGKWFRRREPIPHLRQIDRPKRDDVISNKEKDWKRWDRRRDVWWHKRTHRWSVCLIGWVDEINSRLRLWSGISRRVAQVGGEMFSS